MGYNRFGAVAAEVIPLYPGTVMSDYDAGGESGATRIEAALDRACDQIASALTPLAYQQMTEPDLELIVRRATAGQTSATLTLKPIVSGSVHLWTGQPSTFSARPRLDTDRTDEYGGNFTGELLSSAFSVNLSTGAVTLSTALQANDVVYATYQVDVNSASFSMPSLARIAIRGAAAELGARLYTEANQEWGLVSQYADGFDDDLKDMKDGSKIPDELRLMRWWQELERTSKAAGSVRLYRGG